MKVKMYTVVSFFKINLSANYLRTALLDISSTCGENGETLDSVVKIWWTSVEFKSVKGIHPLIDQKLGYAAPLVDLAWTSTRFSGAITTHFCFSYSLGGVFAMMGGLHTRLCHAFQVCFWFLQCLHDLMCTQQLQVWVWLSL